MSLWRFTNLPLEVGDKLDGLFVETVEYRVLPSIKIGNYVARDRGWKEEPEVPQRCVRLGGAQLSLPFR